MPFGPAFYTHFWTALRTAYPNVPCHTGYRRRPDDVDHNFIGHRLDVPRRSIYVHMWFRGAGPVHDLVVDVYCTNREDQEWGRVEETLATDPALQHEREVGDTGARIIRLVENGLTPAAVTEDQDNLTRRLVEAYLALLGAVNP